MAYVVFVRIRRTEKIVATVRDIEHECCDLIAELRLFPKSAQIHLELWMYSKHGTYRFFRVRDDGLEELDRDGCSVSSASPEGSLIVMPVTKEQTGNGAGALP